MATVSVSSQSGLMKALDSANAGDKIVLQVGNYGSLTLNGNSQKADYKFENLTIASASGSNPAVFDMVNLANVTNVTFDGIKFDYNANSNTSKAFIFNGTKGISIVNSEIDGMISDGHGTGQGLWVTSSSDFRLENTEVTNFTVNSHFRQVDNLKVINNTYTGASQDAMTFGAIDGALIQGNSITMKGEPGVKHRDMMQFWTDGSNAASSDIVIRGNTLTAAESTTHGIFMGNDVAHKGGGLSTYYQDILIENNTIKSGQIFGILAGQSNGLTIHNNTVLQHSAIDSDRPINIPLIYVEDDSRDVSVTGNTTHKTPVAASSDNNWLPENKPSSWTIADNTIVPLGTTGGSSGGGSEAPSAPSAPSLPSLPSGDGEADTFRYNGNNIDGTERVTFKNVDFNEGDRITLSNFDNGTFRHYAGDNGVSANAARTAVTINSLVDIQELVTAAPDVRAVFQTTNNTLVMRIAQDDGTLNILLPGYAAAYKSTFDADLF